MKKIVVYVQHLLGIGHLHRTALITSALEQAGFNVTVISGGMPEESVNFGAVNFVQLEPVKTDPEFTALYDRNGNVIDDCFKQKRTQHLLDTVNQVGPDMVLIETYPFGRRQMRFELLPLLKHLRVKSDRRVLIASSIRDVIQPKSNPKRALEAVDLIDEYFDTIFVHGDESFIAFQQTFPLASRFKEKLAYTGYVVKPLKLTSKKPRDENTVLISAGGGAVGAQIYQTVLKASNRQQGKNFQWHMLIGQNYSESDYDKLLNEQHQGLKIERNRRDFLELLSHCSLSISQAGYNTMMDLLVTKTPAIVIPFEGVAEREQLIRAQRFEEYGMAKVIRESNLNSVRLLDAMDDITKNHSPHVQLNLDGAGQMVEIIRQKLIK